MLGMLRGLKFRTDVMERKAGKSFTAATELADTLVRKANIPFRSAHRIVGKLALDGKYSPSLEELDEVAMAVVGFKVSEYLTDDDLKKAVDPKLIVESRSNVGGTSREEVERMLEERKKLVLSDAENLSSIICGVTSKLEKLYQEVESILR
jgi:argininosuccinate lyase